MKNSITVSIVSHGHGPMIDLLVDKILEFNEVSRVILTLNIPEDIKLISNDRLIIIKNNMPKGFGANHNYASRFCLTQFYCVLNPDIVFLKNPFSELIKSISLGGIGLIAPRVINKQGLIEDSIRVFPTIKSLALRKLLNINKNFNLDCDYIYAPWVAGMFMFFEIKSYKILNGFDEKYFLYCEDVDICTRIWKLNLKVIVANRLFVIHDAQRDSRHNFKYMLWHMKSMLRYQLKFIFRFPRINY
jgi:GT2 family glycosyltransferase